MCLGIGGGVTDPPTGNGGIGGILQNLAGGFIGQLGGQGQTQGQGQRPGQAGAQGNSGIYIPPDTAGKYM